MGGKKQGNKRELGITGDENAKSRDRREIVGKIMGKQYTKEEISKNKWKTGKNKKEIEKQIRKVKFKNENSKFIQ